MPAKVQPVVEVVAHVVAAKGQHGPRVATHLANRSALSSSSGFGANGGGQINAKIPVEGLIDQRDGSAAAASKNESGNRDAVGVFPFAVNTRALRCRRGKSGIGMCSRFAALFVVRLALPVDQSVGYLFGHSFPPYIAIRGNGHISKYGISADGRHGIGVAFFVGTR